MTMTDKSSVSFSSGSYLEALWVEFGALGIGYYIP